MDGQEAKAYILSAVVVSADINVSGFYTGSTAGVEIKGCRDQSLAGTTLSSFDTTARSDVIGTDSTGKPKYTVTLNILNRADSQPAVDQLQLAHITRTEIPLVVCDRALALVGCRGLVANFKVHGITQGAPFNDTETYDIDVRPASCPAWLKVSG